ncbi:MAG TPA: glycosyl hydrolase [Streptosporangiaceae bacterium]|nr:glycosyl hydrolase [Streptosporangiaceae bacterium]
MLKRVAAVLLSTVALAGCLPFGSAGHPARPACSAKPPLQKAVVCPTANYFGFALKGNLKTLGPLTNLETVIGRRTTIGEYYAAFGEPLRTSDLIDLHAHHVLPLIVWEPFHARVQDIASGHSDRYLGKWATGLAALGFPVVLDFGHEFNGAWYPWGRTHETPAEFTAAFQHVHDVLTKKGAVNIIWMWRPTAALHQLPLAPWYPGDEYVTWVGLAGYYGDQYDRTFDKVFGPIIQNIRSFTNRPLLIAETGAPQGPLQADQVKDMLGAVWARPDVLGLIYFNMNTKRNWALDPDALRAFKQGLAAG